MKEKEALVVLFEVRCKLGRNYKSAIRSAWMNGDYEGQGLTNWSSRLQSIRNQFGPSWLVQVGPRALAFAKANQIAVTFSDINCR